MSRVALLKAARKLFQQIAKIPSKTRDPYSGEITASFSRGQLKQYSKKFGTKKTREYIARGIAVNRKRNKYDRSRFSGMFGKEMPFERGIFINPTVRGRGGPGGGYERWQEFSKKFKDRGLLGEAMKNEQSQFMIPYELQNWKMKTIKPFIAPGARGGYTPGKILFYEPKIGAQFVVTKSRHLAKKSSGGYGNSNFDINVGGKNVTIRGPWSGRGGLVRTHGDKNYKGWNEKTIRERYNILKERDDILRKMARFGAHV